jgi:hypothetical protein
MKVSLTQSSDFGWTIRRLMSVLFLAGLIGSAAIGPALADERDQGRNGERDQRDQQRRGQGEQRGERAAPHDRRDVRAPIRRDRRPAYGYDVPTYGEVPPPIVYAPPEPPAGISLFFNFR